MNPAETFGGVIVYGEELGELYGYGKNAREAWLYAAQRAPEQSGARHCLCDLNATQRLIEALTRCGDFMRLDDAPFSWWLNDSGYADLEED